MSSGKQILRSKQSKKKRFMKINQFCPRSFKINEALKYNYYHLLYTLTRGGKGGFSAEKGWNH